MAENCRYPLDPLVDVMARLRGPDGCPWDKEQDHATLRQYLLEEAYEAVEAAMEADRRHLAEELGDVLLQVVFHGQIAAEAGDFDVNTVIQGITEKLIRRHPHIFGDVTVASSADVERNWEAIKAKERGVDGQTAPSLNLAAVGRGLPALSRAFKVQKKAAKVGFDWPSIEGPLAKVREELVELEEAYKSGDVGRMEEELGDLLFSAVNVARFCHVEPEVALTGTVAKFSRRFAAVEAGAAAQGKKLTEMTLEEMDLLWEQAKKHQER